MESAYIYVTAFSAFIWMMLLAFCSPGTWRVIRGKARKYDLLATLFAAVAFNRTGYGMVRLSFWESGKFHGTELLSQVILNVFSVLCVLMVFRVLIYYRAQDDAGSH